MCFERCDRVLIGMWAGCAENCFFDIVGIHLLKKTVSIEVNIKWTAKRTNMGVSINFFDSAKFVHDDLLIFILLKRKD